MKINFRISVITVNLNNLQGLMKTAKSIPICGAIEWVVIDGLSTDGSIEFLNGLQRKPDMLISEKDSGIYDAMNKGIKLSSGEYLNFMNSGDCFKEIFFDSFFDNFNGNCDIIYGNTELSTGQIIIQPSQLDFFFILNKMINHQSLFIKRKLLLKYPFSLDFTIVADWIQLFNILKFENPTIKYINKTICVYDMTGVSSKNEEKRKSEKLNFLKSVYSDWELNDLLVFSKIKVREWNPLIQRAIDSYRIGSLLKLLNNLMRWIRI